MANSRFKIQAPSLQESLPEKQRITIVCHGEKPSRRANCPPEGGLYEEPFPPIPALFARIKSEYDSATISFVVMPNSF